MDSSTKLEQLKNKDESAQSAIASQVVREHLAGFIRSKHSGSSTQINNIAIQPTSSLSGTPIQLRQQILRQRLQDQNPCFSDKGESDKYYGNNGNHLCNQADDHPLRKTASMPTMHIPYKAQSTSRKRQMERRTTLSPLIRGKPRQKTIAGHDSNSTEYSSNPCIVQSTLATSSYSRPCSPLSTPHYHHQQLQQPLIVREANSKPSANQQQSTALTNNNSQTNASSHNFSNKDVENSLHSSPAVNQTPMSIHQQTNRSLNSYKGNNDVTSMDVQNSTTCSNPNLTAQQITSRQHHLMVNEVVRKKVIQRVSSKGRMVSVGGSLDMDAPSGLAAAAFRNGAHEPTMAHCNKSRNHDGGVFKDELRQLSLDGADMRSVSTVNKFTMGGIPLQTGNISSLMQRDLHKLRLATTNDAVAMRRSQSPSSSISMGLSGNQATASMIHHQNSQQHPPRYVAMPGLVGAHKKHYSSSSSSTSSLLSQQDSLEESQAIDLSSSSDSNRHRHQKQSNSLYVNRSQIHNNSQLMSNVISKNQQQHSAHSQHYQKVLQDSFNQLQLCHPQQDGLKQLLMSGQANTSQHHPHHPHHPHLQQHQHHHPQQQQHHHHQQQQQQQQQQQHHHHHCTPSQLYHQHPPSLLEASKTATSLDSPCTDSPEKYTALSQQYNLSASAQSLISLRQQQEDDLKQASNSSQQQQFDINQWAIPYNSFIKPTLATDLHQQQSDHQIVNAALLNSVANLAEPYKSHLLAQLIEQQQQFKASHKIHLESNTENSITNQVESTTPIPDNSNPSSSVDQRSHISRALSSPLLVSGGKDVSVDCCMEQPQPQEQVFDWSTNLLVEQQLRLDQQHQTSFCKTKSYEEDENNNDDGEDVTRMIIDSVDGTKDLRSGHLGNCEETNRIDLELSRKLTLAYNSQNSSLDLSISASSNNNNNKTSSGLDNQSKFSEDSSQSPSNIILPDNNDLQCQNKNSKPVKRYEQRQLDTKLNFVNIPKDFFNPAWNIVYSPKFKDNGTTGLVYELEMCNHKCICGNEASHPENSYRILAIWRRLFDSGLMEKCTKIGGRKATLEELQLCHGETYSCYFGTNPYERIKLSRLDLSKLEIEGLTKLECGGHGADIDTAWNEELTPGVARLAAGCVIEAAIKVAKGILMNAFAVVRPPGHHAEFAQAMGFCFFNSIAIAARVLLTKNKLARILIVDWDVHHGNGIQKQFYEDKNVMYISLHRHDKGNFFPGTGGTKEIGNGSGIGHNWNIAWSGDSMGDAEYMAAFRCLVMPIARDFNPSMVLVACGFDAAQGHPFNFGGYDLSPGCFAYMTRQLMSLANGRLVLCLEGGYQLETICDCAEACVKALLNESHHGKESRNPNQSSIDHIKESELRREPKQSAIEVLYEVSNLAKLYWPGVERCRRTIEMSALEAANMR